MASYSSIQSLHLNSLGPFRCLCFLPHLIQKGRRGAATSTGMKACRLSSLDEVSEYECDEVHDDTGAREKKTALLRALTQTADEFSTESMPFLQRFFNPRRAPVISTGSLKLDLALGIGGLPKGRMVEIYGREASGKTTLALHIIKEAQKLGGYCAYLDVENAMDASLAESMGIDTEKLLMAPPDSAENMLSMVYTLTKSGSVDVIVVDSVAALVPQHEIDTLVGGIHGDIQSRIMNQALRKINYSLCRSQTLVVFLNQVRSSLKSGQGLGHAVEITCGGNALKFYSAVRLKMIRKGLRKSKDEVTGLKVCVEVVKNKLAPAAKTAELDIQFGRGFHFASEALELACEHKVIEKEGDNYRLGKEVFGDRHEVERYLDENSGVLGDMVLILRRQLFESEE
uniref:DNA repair protein recA homolog 2-like isoform X1 n=1 Tax=Rhizophora mucronata TaxID=61149 RepID=A0A2P2J3I4_RHIMU